MAHVARLIIEWTLRRGRLRILAADSADGYRWLYSIRIRILNYLLSRHSKPAKELSLRGAAGQPALFAPAAGTYCAVSDPLDSPPKACRVLGMKLREIARCNDSRRRWRFWP
jgi:hypothetical protein